MIFYLALQKYTNTINNYLASWGKTLIPWIKPLPYEQLSKAKVLKAGTYIFSDIERLNLEQEEMAARVWENLANSGKEVCLLNHPTRSMRRYELLRTLHERGLNKFNIYRLTECRMPQGFPVFIRGENDHFGSLTFLLQTPEELDDAVKKVFSNGWSRENKIITEFCDTSDAKGIFRKYSSFIVGNRVIPRHVFFSRNWVLKHSDLVDEEMLQEEWQYLKNNPHELQLREIFQLARINYGRIDYSLMNGEIQVWEINTNPMPLRPVHKNCDELKRTPLNDHFSQQLKSAFEVIDCQTDPGIRIPIAIKTNSSKEINTRQLMIDFIVRQLPYQYQFTTRRKLNALAQLPRKQR